MGEHAALVPEAWKDEEGPTGYHAGYCEPGDRAGDARGNDTGCGAVRAAGHGIVRGRLVERDVRCEFWYPHDVPLSSGVHRP
jgi:hypothetical protein